MPKLKIKSGYVSDDFRRIFFLFRKKVFSKSGRVFSRNTVECEPVPIRVLNPRACGVHGRRPGGGCRATKPPARKKVENKFFQQKQKKCLLKSSET